MKKLKLLFCILFITMSSFSSNSVKPYTGVTTTTVLNANDFNVGGIYLIKGEKHIVVEVCDYQIRSIKNLQLNSVIDKCGPWSDWTDNPIPSSGDQCNLFRTRECVFVWMFFGGSVETPYYQKQCLTSGGPGDPECLGGPCPIPFGN